MEQKSKRFLRRDQVTDTTGLGESTVRMMVRQGKFPKPVRIGGSSVAWVESEIHDWMDERIAERDNENAQDQEVDAQ